LASEAHFACAEVIDRIIRRNGNGAGATPPAPARGLGDELGRQFEIELIGSHQADHSNGLIWSVVHSMHSGRELFRVAPMHRISYKRFMLRTVLLLLPPALLLAALVTACSSMPKQADTTGGVLLQNNQGYSLLYKVVSDDSDVDKIFFLKHADENVGSLVKEVASVCKDAKKQLDNFQQSDNSLRFDVPDLPYIEQRSRDLQSSADTKKMLSSSGEPFEVFLIYTQAESTEHAQQLALALAEKETDPRRKDFLTKFAARCGQLNGLLLDLLSVKNTASNTTNPEASRTS
jgi:hypothetical protein